MRKLKAAQRALLIEIDNASEWDNGGARPGHKLTRIWCKPWPMPHGTNRATLATLERAGLITEINIGFYVITERGMIEAKK